MIERTINIDLQDGTASSGVTVNQGNIDTVTFIFKVYDGANEIDYEQFTAARLTLTKNKRVILNSQCIVERDCVRYNVEPEAVGDTGTIQGQLDLSFDNGNQSSASANLATSYFSFDVIPSLAALPEGDKKIFVNEINELMKRLEELVDSASGCSGEIDELIADLQQKTAVMSDAFNEFEEVSDDTTELAKGVREQIVSLASLIDNANGDGGEIAGLLDAARGMLSELGSIMSEAAIARFETETSRNFAETAKEATEALYAKLKAAEFVTKDELEQTVEAAMGRVDISSLTGSDKFESFRFDVSYYQSNWSILTECPYTLASASMAYHDGKAYFFGCGTPTNGNVTFIYDLDTHTWEIGPSTPLIAVLSSAVYYEGKFYVCGGSANKNNIQIYDVATESWSQSAVLPDSYGSQDTAAIAYNGKIYLFGGSFFDARVYDIASNSWSWTVRNSVVMNSMSGNAVLVGDEVYLFGTNSNYEEVSIYNIVNDSFRAGTKYNATMQQRAAILISPYEILVFGVGLYGYKVSAVYNIITDTWSHEYSAPYGNTRSRGLFYNNKVYIFGATTSPVGMVMVYERPPERLRLMSCKAGDTVFASCELITDSGQVLSPNTENVIESTGYIEYRICTQASMITGWKLKRDEAL